MSVHQTNANGPHLIQRAESNIPMHMHHLHNPAKICHTKRDEQTFQVREWDSLT